MKRINKFLTLALFTLLVLFSCTKTGLIKGNQKTAFFEVKITGNINEQLKFEGACTQVNALYFPIDQSYPNERSLTIHAFNGSKLFALNLYWPGAFPSNLFFDFNLNTAPPDQFGAGYYTPDISNTGTFYAAELDKPGGCTITNYDQSTQTISGTFQFTAEKFVNSTPSGSTVTISGSFNNIPIKDFTDQNNPKGPCNNTTGNSLGSGSSGGGGGGGGGGGSTSTITFSNPTFTTMNITFNGQSKTAVPGGTAVFTGTANANATGTATTSGKTTSGTQVGLLLTWTLNQIFPAGGTNQNVTINVNSNYFFLKMKNQTSQNFQKVYVNYGLQNQTLDNISILNNGTIYNLGYYSAFSNSNVRAESSTTAWTWNSLNLPFTNNQTITVQ